MLVLERVMEKAGSDFAANVFPEIRILKWLLLCLFSTHPPCDNLGLIERMLKVPLNNER